MGKGTREQDRSTKNKLTTVDLRPHPLTETVPPMEPEQLEALAADIKNNGQQVPIIRYEGMILDGRARYKAAIEAGCKPIFEEYIGDDPEENVLSLNARRRNLTKSQRAIWAAKMDGVKHGTVGGNRKAPEGQKCLSELAATFNVSETMIKTGRQIIKKSAPELAELVEKGKVNLTTANRLSEFPKEKQVEAVKLVDNGEKPHEVLLRLQGSSGKKPLSMGPKAKINPKNKTLMERESKSDPFTIGNITETAPQTGGAVASNEGLGVADATHPEATANSGSKPPMVSDFSPDSVTYGSATLTLPHVESAVASSEGLGATVSMQQSPSDNHRVYRANVVKPEALGQFICDVKDNGFDLVGLIPMAPKDGGAPVGYIVITRKGHKLPLEDKQGVYDLVPPEHKVASVINRLLKDIAPSNAYSYKPATAQPGQSQIEITVKEIATTTAGYIQPELQAQSFEDNGEAEQ